MPSSSSSSSSFCLVRVVLLCKGRGADAASYKPHRDESQWWNRRDALVRCVAAFLHGPSHNNDNNDNDNNSILSTTTRELILVYDEDFSCMEMTTTRQQRPDYNDDEATVPKEEDIVRLWKSAALNPNGPPSVFGNITCRLVVLSENDTTSSQQDATTTTASPFMTSVMDDSKRSILAHLQESCSMEFLRRHGLNSPPEVVLRKTNKKALLQIWEEKKKKSSKKQQSITDKNDDTRASLLSSSSRSRQQQLLGAIFDRILKPNNSAVTTTMTTRVVAGLLHESADAELPCYFESFGEEEEERQKIEEEMDHHHLQVCLFLGAVRDMHPWENRVLHRCCQQAHVPLVRVRLGPVPEFTSKILTVVAYHHAHDRLGPALWLLSLRLCGSSSGGSGNTTLDTQSSSRKRRLCKNNHAPQSSLAENHHKLHVICTVPFESTNALSSDISKRSRAMWCLVRVTVCTLWRSRVASSAESAAIPLENTLTLLFQDGVLLTLEQEEFIAALAGQHQAAPCEYQVLQALLVAARNSRGHIGDWETNPRQMVHVGKKIDSDAVWYAVHLRKSEDTTSSAEQQQQQLSTLIYTSTGECRYERGNLLAVLHIQDDDDDDDALSSLSLSHKRHVRCISGLCGRLAIPVVIQSLIPRPVPDQEAASITMLQHFIYQGRLFQALKKRMSEDASSIARNQQCNSETTT